MIISVIDDDESVRIATTDLLSSVGFACEAFESAEAYLKSEKVGLTSCLILDLSMPGMNGLELQQQLAQDGVSVPIVFITAFPTECARARAALAGAVCFLAKPYSDEELLNSLETALNRSQRGALQLFRGNDQSGSSSASVIRDGADVHSHRSRDLTGRIDRLPPFDPAEDS